LGRRPRNLVTLKPVPAGTSGGVTLYGWLGAILGAALIAIVGTLAKEWQAGTLVPPSYLVVPASLPVITIAGFAGCVLDSLLGATVQEKRRCRICETRTEKSSHCQQVTQRIGGVPGLNNDVVNFLCGALGGLVVWGMTM